MLFLLLGVVAPLLLIIGGTLWLLVKWLLNQRRLAMQATALASPSIDSNKMQSPLHAVQSASDTPLSTLTPATDASEASGVPMQAPLAQTTYTPSDLRPITTTFPQPILTMHSNEAASYPLTGDLRPLFVDSLNLSLELTRPIESNGNQQMPLLVASPTVLVDAPTSCMPSSPPVSSVPL
jgi:hypothetical protein